MLSYQSTARLPGAAGLVLTGVHAVGDTLRMAFNGEIDISTASALADTLSVVLQTWPHRRVCLDLAGVGFLDSSGISALLSCRRLAEREGRQLLIVDARDNVRRILDLTGVLELLAPTLAAGRGTAAPAGQR